MNRRLMISIVLAWISALLSGLAIGMSIGETTIQGEITGKHEEAERCFVDLRIEIPPNDYIGLDIGDEYEIERN